MDFIFDLPIPADTSKAALEEKPVDVGAGIIHQVEIEEPRGCSGEVFAAVRQGLHQVWPTNEDGFYRSDGRVYSTREHYLIKKGDAPLIIQGWSPGTTYPHTLQFRFSVLPQEVMEPWQAQMGILDTLLRLLGVRPKKGTK